MPWIEVKLQPQLDWNEDALGDWTQALGAFLTEKGLDLKPKTRILPGYQVLALGDDGEAGEIILSASERIVLLEGWALKDAIDQEFAYLVTRVARDIGARGICIPVESTAEEDFWLALGGVVNPDPVPLADSILREKVGVQKLAKLSLLVTYENQPALCLEPIACNAHGPGPVSLAQRRLEKKLGGRPLGFASRVAVHCPWEINKSQWDDLLAFSRLQSFDLLYELVKTISY